MRAVIRHCALIVASTAAAPVLAHGGHRHIAGPPGWTWDPWIIVPLLLSATLFIIGWVRLHARSGLGAAQLRRRLALFGGGWATLGASLVSPLHEAGERSFAAHMSEHELLMLLAAPLLVLAEPLAIMLWAFPADGRRMIGRLLSGWPIALAWDYLSGPVAATAIQAIALWLWHAPALFDLALEHEGWHAIQHLSFLLSALLFWSAMLRRRGASPSLNASRSVAALCLFATSIVSGALGALMAFSQSPWYVGYARLGMAPFGLTPSEDQQLAGLIMWIPGGIVHAAVALLLVRGLLTAATPARAADAF